MYMMLDDRFLTRFLSISANYKHVFLKKTISLL